MTEADPLSEAERKDLLAAVAWAFQALVAVAGFAAVTVLSRGDWELLTRAQVAAAGAATGFVEVPIVGLKVVFLALFVVGPAVLVAMQGYLLIQLGALMEGTHGGAAVGGLLRNHARWWPMSLLGVSGFLLAPTTIALFVWKIWPLRFTSDSGEANGWQGIVLGLLALSLLVSLIAMRQQARTRPTVALWRWLGGAALLVAPPLGLALALGVGGLADERRLDLRGAPLAGADLRAIDLRHADLRGARLAGARLGGAWLEDARLEGAALDQADLRGARLAGATLAQARLNAADLRGACLLGVALDEVEIEGANLRHAWMIGAWLRPVRRTRADRAAPLTPEAETYERNDWIDGADLENAKLCAADIGSAQWRPYVDVGSPAPMPVPYYAAPNRWGIPAPLRPENYPDRLASDWDSGAAFVARDRFRAAEARRCIAAVLADARLGPELRGACAGAQARPLRGLPPPE